MRPAKESGLHDEAVITWCVCERCGAAGPRFMTLIRNHRQYTVRIDSHCCVRDSESEFIYGETPAPEGVPMNR